MGDRNSVSEPLLLPRSTTITVISPQNDDASSPTTSSPNSAIVLRLVFLSLVATSQSGPTSKGFRVTVVNALPRDSRLGQRFDLLYVSNDKATRMLLTASDFVEDLLYGGEGYESAVKKPVSHVTLSLGGGDFSGVVSVRSSGEENGFVVELSPTVMEESDVDRAVESAVLRGMARVWLWDNGAPSEILSGVVEHIAVVAGFGSGDSAETMGMIRCGHDHHNRANWFVDKDPRFVASLLFRCDEEERGSSDG